MARLNERTIIWLATTRPDGRPHLTAANFRMFTSTCPPRATSPWTDVHPGAVVELRVLEAVGRVLVVRARPVVEQLGQRPHDVVVVVEHLVVVPGRPAVATHEHRRGIVDHDLPEVSEAAVFAQLTGMPPTSRASYVPAEEESPPAPWLVVG
jgi:hypothetical protein